MGYEQMQMAHSGRHNRHSGQNVEEGQRGAEQFAYKQTKQEISNIETNMEDLVQLYGQRLRARTGRAASRRDDEEYELGKKLHARPVAMHQCNKDCSTRNLRMRE